MVAATHAADALDVGELRAALTSLRYEQPLDDQSAPLVGALLADLLHKDRELKRHAKELASAGGQLEPLKHDNSNLLKENNQLHLELIKRAEEAAARERAHDAATRALERENANLRFVAAQQAERLRVLERDADALRTKAEHALAQANLVLPQAAQVRKRSAPPKVARCARRRRRRRQRRARARACLVHRGAPCRPPTVSPFRWRARGPCSAACATAARPRAGAR